MKQIFSMFILFITITSEMYSDTQNNMTTNIPQNSNQATRIVTVVAPTLTSLSLESNVTILNVEDTAELTVMATYSDGSTKELNVNVEWIITPAGSMDANGSLLTAKRDGNVTVHAKVDGVNSNTLNLNITWVVNGHILPPEPDPVENDATLGGVDSNNDGVRDDVERRIYKKYPVRLQTELMMDGAQYFQKIMTNPSSEERKLKEEGTRVGDCALYLMDHDSEINSDDFDRIGFLEDYIVSNKARVQKYLDYNIALSGGVYGSSPSDWNKDACSDAVREVLKEMGK